jgi:tetratricopeptide (TPR) repeat protein
MVHRRMILRAHIAPLLLSLLAAGCGKGGGGGDAATAGKAPPAGDYAGSKSCRECHERFHQLWSTSHHGLAMQPFTPALAAAFREQAEPIVSGGYAYRADLAAARVIEKGPAGERSLPVAHVLGGRNVYYLLTPLDRGRLQTLPVAYDVRRREWYDTSASAMRHFGGDVREQRVHWTEPEWTFNTSCHGCHVSQFAANFDLGSGTYRTTWAEPGINCETCHGGSAAHVRACREAPAGTVPKDLKIIVTKTFTPEQMNAMCSPCHAKMSPITASFTPGERYFDHFDLVALESRDFYPDGRDLGENYTVTGWRMSACAVAGELHCVKCHTSSGRYRFKEPGRENDACLPCHAERVRDVLAHSHHPAGKPGTRCVECHMPTTEFARMTRSDHSMRPPAPAATLAYQSPNACTGCHADHDAAWADRQVRTWHAKDYQAPILARASLVAAARKGEWARLDEMRALIAGASRDEVFAVSLVRLLRACPLEGKQAVLLAAAKSPSPWVRAAAMEALGDRLTPEGIAALAAGCRDGVRLVRVRAAYSLAAVRPEQIAGGDRAGVEAATRELEASLTSRPDDHASHYNLGNIFMSRRDPARAAAAFETAIRLRPDVLPQHLNISLAYNALGRNREAEGSLRRALALDPRNVPANLNLGMLLAELNRLPEAEAAFRAALEAGLPADARNTDAHGAAVAAYNLGILVSRDRPAEGLAFCRKAASLEPGEPKYAYTLAFHLARTGGVPEAVSVLERLLDGPGADVDAYVLLGDLYERQGRAGNAQSLLRRGAEDARLPEGDRARLRSLLRR